MNTPASRVWSVPPPPPSPLPSPRRPGSCPPTLPQPMYTSLPTEMEVRLSSVAQHFRCSRGAAWRYLIALERTPQPFVPLPPLFEQVFAVRQVTEEDIAAVARWYWILRIEANWFLHQDLWAMIPPIAYNEVFDERDVTWVALIARRNECSHAAAWQVFCWELYQVWERARRSWDGCLTCRCPRIDQYTRERVALRLMGECLNPECQSTAFANMNVTI